jgi:hypothetical protein
MQAARRLYLYAMSGITLGVIAAGVAMLLDVAITSSGILEHPYVPYPGRREQLSQAIAMLAVGLPVWAVHWWFVQRGLAAGRPERDAERGSAIRAVYLTLVLLASLVAWVSGTAGLLQSLITTAAGGLPDYYYGPDPVSSVTSAIAGFMVWLYHGVVRRGDLRAGAVHGAATWIPRLYLYGISIGALVAALARLEGLVTATLVPEATGADYSRFSAIESLVAIVAWGLVWAGHWRYASGVARADDWRGAEERISRTRLAAFITTIVTAAGFTIAGVAGAVQGIAAPLIGDVPYEGDASGNLWVGPLVSAIAWAVVWWAYLRGLRREPAAAEPLRVLHQARLENHGMGAAALAFGAAGLGWMLGMLIDIVLGGVRMTDPDRLPWTFELARFLPMAAFGLGIWAWQWSRVLGRRGRDPNGEANSTIRRAFLYLTLAVSLVVALGSAALILYRLVGTVIGADLEGNAVSALSTPLGALVMATISLGYHGLLLRADMAIGPVEVPPEATEPAPPPAALSGTAGGARRTLELVGSEGVDLDAALTAARASLPEGVRLEDR